jgi:hypothetical protein
MSSKLTVGLVVSRLLADKDEAFSVVLAARNASTGENFRVAMHPSDDTSNHYYDHIEFPVYLSKGDEKKPLYEDLKDGTARFLYQERQWMHFPGEGQKVVVSKPLTEISVESAAAKKDLQLVCMVFVKTTSSAGSVVFELLAQGVVGLAAVLKDPIRVPVKDVENQVQGWVEFGGSGGKEAPIYKPVLEKEEPEKEADKLRSRWLLTLQNFRKRANASGVSDEDLSRVVFSDFEQIDGARRLPIWAFPALARKLADITADGTLADPMKSITLLKHWAAIAVFLQRECGTSPRKWANQAPAERDGNLLAEFLTLPFRAMIYSPDEVHRGKENSKPKRFMTDQWVQLSNFPASPYIGFDCEDGSLLILQIFSWLQAFVKTWKTTKEETKVEWTGTDAEIKALVEIATTSTKYTPFFCLGELQTSADKYSPHAFVVLVPKATLKKAYQDHGHAFSNGSGGLDTAHEVHFAAEGEEALPSILVESTSYTDGAWTALAMDNEKAEEAFDNAYEPFLIKDLVAHWGMNGMSSAHFRRAVKPKAPVLALRAHKIYKDIFCAVTPFALG